MSLDGETHKNGAIAFQLGEAANMAGLSMLSITQCVNEIAGRPGDKKCMTDTIQNAYAMGKLIESRLFLSLVLENCLQLWIQHGMFIAKRRLTLQGDYPPNHTSDIQQLFSIGTSALTLML